MTEVISIPTPEQLLVIQKKEQEEKTLQERKEIEKEIRELIYNKLKTYYEEKKEEQLIWVDLNQEEYYKYPDIQSKLVNELVTKGWNVYRTTISYYGYYRVDKYCTGNATLHFTRWYISPKDITLNLEEIKELQKLECNKYSVGNEIDRKEMECKDKFGPQT